MSGKLDINILVAAKEEYTKQLVYLLSPEIYKIILNLYKESQQLKKKRSISLRNFQIILKKIPEWNDILVEKHTEDIKKRIPFILDLITAIFVSHVKILACVKFNKKSKSIKVKVPNLNIFLHKIIITISEQIFYNPDYILKKKEEVIIIISNIIEDAIRNQIPIDKILTEYLSGVFDKEVKNKDNSDSDESGDSGSESGDSGDSGDSDSENGDSEDVLDDLKDAEKLENLHKNNYRNQISEDVDDSDDEEPINLDDFKNITTSRPIPESQLKTQYTETIDNTKDTVKSSESPESSESTESTESTKIQHQNNHNTVVNSSEIQNIKKSKVLFTDARN